MKKNNGVLTGVTLEDMDVLKKNPSEFWKGVKEIGSGAFSVARMSQFPTKFSIPEGVKKIGKNAFAGQLVSEVEIADSVEEIDDDAFKTCINLTTFKVSKNSKLKRIGSHAFQFAGLTSFDMPDSVTEVADGAFAYCLHMENMHLSSSLKTLGSSAMVGCTLLPKEKIDASDEVKSTFLGIPTAKQPEADAKKQQPVAEAEDKKTEQQPATDSKKQQPKAEEQPVAEDKNQQDKNADSEKSTQNKADKKADAEQSKEEKKATQPKPATTTQNKSDKKAQQSVADAKKTETPTTTQENKSEEKNDESSKATKIGESKYSAEIDALFNKLASQKITEDQLKTALEGKLQELSETATVEELKQFRGTVALAEEAFVSALKSFDYDAEKLAAYTDAKDAISGMTFGKK